MQENNIQNTMPKYKIHVCFVSDQPLPTVLPILIEGSKPEKVYLLTSKDMQEKSKDLKRVLKNKNVNSEVIEIKNTAFTALESEISSFLNTCNDKDELSEIAFNLTGGTKLMTLAGYNACKELEIPTFYVDTRTENITILDTTKTQECHLPDLLSIEDILNSYGYRIEKVDRDIIENEEEIIKILANVKSPKGILTLNGCCAQAKDLSFKVRQDTHPDFIKLLKDLANTKILSYEERNDYVVFASETARDFCHGIWLEPYVSNALEQLKRENRIIEHRQSVNVKRFDSKNITNKDHKDNEFDNIFIRKNTLNLIECKTAKMNESEKVTNIIYKLDSLHTRIGGIFAHGILISCLPLSETELKRAKDNKITVIDDFNKIKNLKKTLIEIFDTKK